VGGGGAGDQKDIVVDVGSGGEEELIWIRIDARQHLKYFLVGPGVARWH